MRILIKNVILNGKTTDIYINSGKIEEIGLGLKKEAEKIINGECKVALPSFINGHTHAAMTIFRGYADDMPLSKWLTEKIWVLESKLTEEDVYWGAKLACLEMIKNGITVFNDMYWHWEATARATKEMGLRGFISAVFIDMFDEKKAKEQIELNLKLYELSKEFMPNVVFTLGPHAIYSVSKESLTWTRDFSEKNGTLVHMHLSETEDEVRFAQERYNMSPVEFLDSIGLLSERFIGCHGCWLSEKECEILGKRGAKLVHMPVSNMKLAVGKVIPHSFLSKFKVDYCLGTDGCASNNNLDMMETMKFASLLAKFSTGDPTILNAPYVYELATKKAASIFNLGEWEIKVGLETDIILVDLLRPELTPNFDLYSDIVYSANGYCVDTVICMGNVIMENRVVPGEEEIIRNAKKVARSLVKRI
ncbi:MAG: amidohydrolase [Desulfobacterota bacterium]|nr:amidohydrolase [Thermodesulfobacteriota bacterium]MDW8002036.1 amidohydrolase [Deltaproteobacteria bacterium]